MKKEMDILDEVHIKSRWLPNHGDTDVTIDTTAFDDEEPPSWEQSDGLTLKSL